jgi:hypothetical protein
VHVCLTWIPAAVVWVWRVYALRSFGYGLRGGYSSSSEAAICCGCCPLLVCGICRIEQVQVPLLVWHRLVLSHSGTVLDLAANILPAFLQGVVLRNRRYCHGITLRFTRSWLGCVCCCEHASHVLLPGSPLHAAELCSSTCFAPLAHNAWH